MSENTKKTIKNVVFVAFFAVLVVAFVVSYNFYRSYCGCFIVPNNEIELSQMADNTISVMSYNIKRDYVAQNQEEAENSWENRAKLVSNILNEYKPAIVGMQEVRLSQEFYLSRYLSGFDSVVQYRDSGLFAESNPIFYRNDMFSLIKSETFG